MYNNEYLENCIKEKNGCNKLIWNYKFSKYKEFENLVVNDLGFISTHKDELELFRQELINANINEFILIDTSTALMSLLHGLNSVGIVYDELTIIKYNDVFGVEEIKGIKMKVQ